MTNGTASETNGIPRGTNGDGLLSCPFCGGEAVETIAGVSCTVCGGTMHGGVHYGGADWHEVVAAWNTRAEDAATAEMAQRIQSLELECAKLQEELRKAGK